MVDDSHTSCGVVSCTVDSQFLSIEESYLPSYNHFSVTIRRCLPAPGPAVGLGLDGDRARRGQDLEAESWPLTPITLQGVSNYLNALRFPNIVILSSHSLPCSTMFRQHTHIENMFDVPSDVSITI